MNVIKPHLPEGKCRVIVADKNMFLPDTEEFDVIYTPESRNILKGINTHPDMQVCHLGGAYISVCAEFYEYYNEKLIPYGIEVIKGKSEISSQYPQDIAFNCLILGNTLYHKLSHTEKTILEFARKNDMNLVDVKQGYTKCSTLVVDENSVITSDKGLYRIYEKNGVDVMYTDTVNIALPGFDCGFIGGCGGLISEKEIYFSGNIEELPEYNNIADFLERKNIKSVYPKERKLTDCGSIVPLIHI